MKKDQAMPADEKLPPQVARAVALYCAAVVATGKHAFPAIGVQLPIEERVIQIAAKFATFIEG